MQGVRCELQSGMERNEKYINGTSLDRVLRRTYNMKIRSMEVTIVVLGIERAKQERKFESNYCNSLSITEITRYEFINA